MLRAFGHPVATCWVVLPLKYENGQIFHATFVNVAWCCSRLARLVQQCCVWACALVRFLTRNMSQHVATGGQTRATCCAQQCCDLLCSNVAIVWPVHANAGPTKLGYVALRCCDRLAGAFNSFGANALSIISALLIKKEILMNIKFARADWLIFIINKSIVFKWAHISQNPGISSLTDASCLVVDDPFTV